jgi:CopG family transcriptional regulator/antitoxin EndoAI
MGFIMKAAIKRFTRKNFTLEAETVRLLERVPKGLQSRFVNEAIRREVASRGRKTLEQRIREGAGKNAEINLRVAEEWFGVDEEAWPHAEEGRARKGR